MARQFGNGRKREICDLSSFFRRYIEVMVICSRGAEIAAMLQDMTNADVIKERATHYTRAHVRVFMASRAGRRESKA